MSKLSFDASLQEIQKLDLEPKGYENVSILDAHGRVLAKDITACEDNPTQMMAAMDGYGIRHCDQELNLPIASVNPAGSKRKVLEAKSAIKTFTGAPMPQGSDTLVPIENVAVTSGTISIKKPVTKGFATRDAAELYAKGDLLLQKGVQLGYAEIGVLSGLNKAFVPVLQKPKVAIVSSGSEILDIAQNQTDPSQIRSTNHIVMHVLAKRVGANVVQLGTVSDDKELLANTLQDALDSSDIVVSSGGVSVGDYDFTKEIVQDHLGCEILFHGVVIKPGQHLLLAKKGKKLILGVPGFAYSATVTFLLYFDQILQKYGYESYFETIKADIEHSYEKKQKGKRAFVAVNCKYIDNGYYVNLEGKKTGSSALLTNLLDGACLMELSEDCTALQKGDTVIVRRLKQSL